MPIKHIRKHLPIARHATGLLAAGALAIGLGPVAATAKPHHDPNAAGQHKRCTVAAAAGNEHGGKHANQNRGNKDRGGKTICTVAQGTPGWGIINRNSFGSPSLMFRTGPYALDIDGHITGAPPFGEGSLNLMVEGPNTGEPPSDADKIAYANSIDFRGVRLSSIHDLSYWVFQGEDNPQNETVPGISIEIDPSNGGQYSNLTYLPDNSTGDSAPDGGKQANTWQQWEPLADGNQWTASGTACTLQTPCSFEQVKAAVGADSPITLSFGFTKGRDNEFQGAVDGLTFNDIVYDFEPPKAHAN